MGINPLGAMPGDGDPGDENEANESPDIEECEQKIADLETRVSALEHKAGIGAGEPAKSPGNAIMKKPGGQPFFGGSY